MAVVVGTRHHVCGTIEPLALSHKYLCWPLTSSCEWWWASIVVMVVMVGGCAVVLAGHCCHYHCHTGGGHNDRRG